MKARIESVFMIVACAAVIVFAGTGLWDRYHGSLRGFKQQPGPVAATGIISKEFLTNTVGTGKLALVEFTDFQCPFCGKHAKETLPVLKERLIDTGKVSYIVANYPLAMHPYAKSAAIAAECAAAEGKFWEVHDKLFSIPLTSEITPSPRCIGDVLAKATAKVEADIKRAEQLGVRGTPSIFLGKLQSDGSVNLIERVGGAVSADLIIKEVEAHLKS